MKVVLPAFGTATVAGAFLGLAALAVGFADLRVTALDPWADLAQFAAGFAPPDFTAIVLREVVLTVAFAVTGVGFGAAVGLLLLLRDPCICHTLQQQGSLIKSLDEC